MITNEIICAYCGDGFQSDELLEKHYSDYHSDHIKQIQNREEDRLNHKLEFGTI